METAQTAAKRTRFGTEQERFGRKVDRRGPDECWPWKGSHTQLGYGQMRSSVNGKVDGAHRISYRLHVGEVVPGLDVMHSCDNPPCVNPAHLRLGTRKENIQDAVSKGRMSHGEQHGAANRRFSKNTVSKIRKLYVSGQYRMIDIARHFGVSQPAISQIVNGRTYGYIEGGLHRKLQGHTRVHATRAHKLTPTQLSLF